MKIAIVQWTPRIVGGAEEYINRLLRLLSDAGHQLMLWCETDQPGHGRTVTLPADVHMVRAYDEGIERALATLASWRPDAIYVNGTLDLTLHDRFCAIAPSVMSLHGYAGVCISGSKSHWNRVPCHRRFGAACLAAYLPLRCGGLNPLTMLRRYSHEQTVLQKIRKYDRTIVHSKYMREEYERHGIDATCIHYPLRHVDESEALRHHSDESSYHLLFAARMTRLKGGEMFLRALPMVQRQLGRSLEVTLAGEGEERSTLEHLAQSLPSTIRCHFPGWISPDTQERLLVESDLLVVPSIWPEPFGMIGPEAAAYAVPAVGFDVGGISDWLVDDESGVLAMGKHPSAAGLAAAIVRALQSPARLERLRAGARRTYERLQCEDIVSAIITVFESAREHRQVTGSMVPANGLGAREPAAKPAR